MDATLKTGLWNQFGAAIDYLEDNIRACPDDLWRASMYPHPSLPAEMSQFWYRAYHTLFWLHLYLTGTEDGFLPPPPFDLIEQTDDGPIPEHPYTKDDLLAYLQQGRRQCKVTIDALTDEKARERCAFSWGEVSFVELIIYNLRHVQEHSAQLNLFLGQHLGPQKDYVTMTRNPTL